MERDLAMPFDVNELMDDLFGDSHCSIERGESIWINAQEFATRTKGMTARQVGQLLLEIVDLYKQGRMKNGPAVRVDPPEDEEATDGTNP
jgi:hypothetical protein